MYWHIDYLLNADVKISEAIWATTHEDRECDITAYLSQSDLFEWGPTGFGAGDCKKSCKSHLLFYRKGKGVIRTIDCVFEHLELEPRKYSDLA